MATETRLGEVEGESNEWVETEEKEFVELKDVVVVNEVVEAEVDKEGSCRVL